MFGSVSHAPSIAARCFACRHDTLVHHSFNALLAEAKAAMDEATQLLAKTLDDVKSKSD
jgi:hypothetical protein